MKNSEKKKQHSPAIAVIIGIFGFAWIISACMLGVASLENDAAEETEQEISEEYIIETEIAEAAEESSDASEAEAAEESSDASEAETAESAE